MGPENIFKTPIKQLLLICYKDSFNNTAFVNTYIYDSTFEMNWKLELNVKKRINRMWDT